MAIIAGSLVWLAAAAVLVVVAPPLMSLTVSVAAAVAWCHWLEHHPMP